MESIHVNITNIDQHDRQALEHVLGKPLRDDQQLIINLVTPTSSTPVNSSSSQSSHVELPDWCNVYQGLNDAEVDRLDQAIQERLNLTRDKL